MVTGAVVYDWCYPLLTPAQKEAFLVQFGLESVVHLPGLDELKAAGFLEASPPSGFDVPNPSDELAPDEARSAGFAAEPAGSRPSRRPAGPGIPRISLLTRRPGIPAEPGAAAPSAGTRFARLPGFARFADGSAEARQARCP
jgi:hypothetical protein